MKKLTILTLFIFPLIVNAETTAERFVKLLHSVNDYPLCNADSCINDIKAKGNTVIATYILPLNSNQFPKNIIINRAEFAQKVRPGVVSELCGSIQKNFPDRNMSWAGHYYSKDGVFLTSVIVKMSECVR